MVKSIKHLTQESILNFGKLEDDFFENPEQIAEYVIGITKELYKVRLLMIKESLEAMNQMLKESGKRRAYWIVEKDHEKELIISLGNVIFTKMLLPIN